MTRRLLTLCFAALLAAAPAQARDTVAIGYSGPLSGGAALYGKNALTGLEMAAAEINEAGGVEVGGKRHRVAIVPLDDRYAPSEAAINAKRLRAQHKAPVIFVVHSGGAFAMQAFNQRDGFIVAAYTSVPEITEKGNRLTLRIPPNLSGYVWPFIDTQMQRYGKKLGMAGADHDYAKTWAALMEPAWKAAGGTVVANNPMSYNKDTDFYSGISRVLAAAPDVLFMGGPSEPSALVLRQARELGFKGGVILMDQAKMDEMARLLGGDYGLLEGAIGTLPVAADQRPGAQAFTRKFREAHGRDPTSETSLNYNALHAVAGAMKLAGTTTDAKAIHARLAEAFAALPVDRNPHAIAGVDEKGGTTLQVVVGFVDKGQVVAIQAPK